MTGEPRYTQYGPIDVAVACQDCGLVVTDQAAHTRFHSILSGHAWALAVLKNRHIAAHVHGKYDVVERINSRKFDSWSGDALAEVAETLGIDVDPGGDAPVTSGLVEHARRELGLIGEDQDVTDWFCRVIAEFASFGHSGGSASICIPVLHQLLQFRALSPLTDDPGEWIDQSEASGVPMWQNRRDSTAFSSDGGRTYWLLDERDAAGSDEVTPLHHSEPSSQGGAP